MSLTRASTLLRGTLWNLLGQVLPVAAALVCVPRLVSGFGVDRFGVLSLAWMLIGYFTLFDLGIGGAVTRAVAERLATGDEDEVPGLVGTALALTLVLGTVGALLLGGGSEWLAYDALRVPPALREETRDLFRMLALSLPIVTTTAAMAGTLAAQQRFDVLNAIRVPMGIYTYAAPLLVLPIARDLRWVAIVLVTGRIVAAIAHLVACFRVTPGLRRGRLPIRRHLVAPLLRFGGWMTVSAVVGPLMVYFDRFLIGAFLSMTMVAYYTTSYDLTSRVGILSAPVVGVLFPALASAWTSEPSRAGRLFVWGLRAVGVLLFPVCFVLATFAPDLLRWWLGDAFAQHGTAVLRLVAIGTFVNGLAQVALALVQASGRPDLGARLHVLELPFYALTLVTLLRSRGIEGAAIAWLARVSLDALVLLTLAVRALPASTTGLGAAATLGAGALAAMIVGATLPSSGMRAALAAVVLIAFVVTAWRLLAQPTRRALAELGVPGTSA